MSNHFLHLRLKNLNNYQYVYFDLGPIYVCGNQILLKLGLHFYIFWDRSGCFGLERCSQYMDMGKKYKWHKKKYDHPSPPTYRVPYLVSRCKTFKERTNQWMNECFKWLLYKLNNWFLYEQLKVSDCKPLQTTLTCLAGMSPFFSNWQKNPLHFWFILLIKRTKVK